MSLVKTPGRSLLWFAVQAVETLMSRLVLICEITFKIHYLVILESPWKSSMQRSRQTPPVALFSFTVGLILPLIAQFAAPSSHDLFYQSRDCSPPQQQLCTVWGQPDSYILRVLKTSSCTSICIASSFYRNISKSFPSWQWAVILIAVPRRGIKG